MRIKVLFAFLMISVASSAQHKTIPSDSIVVKGAIKNPFVITGDSINKREEINIGDVVIKNHTGAIKDTAKAIRGVLLRSLLENIQMDAPNPKVYSEYYIVCKATDGYIVVFSWNELFNSEAGDNIYLVTSKEGKAFGQMSDRIAVICPKDKNTGRRFLKALAEIEIKHAL